MHLIKRHSFLIIAILIVLGLYLFLRSEEAVAPTEVPASSTADSSNDSDDSEL